MDNLSPLSTYQTSTKNFVLISDRLRNRIQSNLTINVCLRKKINIPKQDEMDVDTNIYFDNTTRRFNVMLKRHKDYPIAGVLKTEGFVSPEFKNGALKVVIRNPLNFELR